MNKVTIKEVLITIGIISVVIVVLRADWGKVKAHNREDNIKK